MEATLEAPALLEWSSLRQPEGQAQVAALPHGGSAEGIGVLHTGWVTLAVVPGEVSRTRQVGAHILAHSPFLPFLLFVFKTVRSWCVK